MSMYKLFSFLFFVSTSLLVVSVALWSVISLPISVTFAAVVVSGVVYLSFAVFCIVSRFMAVKRDLPNLIILNRAWQIPSLRIVVNLVFYIITIGLAGAVIIWLTSQAVTKVVLPVYLQLAWEPYTANLPSITEKLTALDGRLSIVEFFSRNKYLYNLSDSSGDYKLEFASLEREASSSSQVYHYNFEYLRPGAASWDEAWDAIKLRDFETVTGLKVTKIYYPTLSLPLLKITVEETENSVDSDGNGHAFLLYPSLKNGSGYYVKLSDPGITRGINIETTTDTDGYPLVTVRFGGWRSMDREKYKLALDTSEGADEIIPKLISAQ